MAQQMQSVQQIPAEVQQLAEIHSLGAPTASYSQRTFKSLLVMILTLLWSLTSIPFFIFALFSSAPRSVFILSALWGGIFFCMFIVLYKRWNQQVHIYTEGFVYLRWRKAEALRWEQIETVWYETEDTESNVWDSLRIRKTDGSELKVRVSQGLRGSSEIYRTIEREFGSIRLTGMIEQYEAGHSIAFDDLSVNKLGLTRQGETLPWSQVQSIEVGEYVEIKKEGEKRWNWFNDRVPNQSLLRELVTHIRSPQ